MRPIMRDDNPQRFLEVALEAVKKAEPIFLKSFGCVSGDKKEHSGVESLVTEADKGIETLLAHELSLQFPDHAIIGEEGTAQKGKGYSWYVDPIDGTTNYIHGIPHCSISVALWDALGPLVAIVHDPIHQATYTALRGGGSFKNGQAIRVSETALLKNAVGGVGWKPRDSTSRGDLIDRIEKSAYRFRVFSGTALDLCFLASGVFDFYVTSSTYLWDVAAGMLIVTEAGGKISEKGGADFSAQSKDILATNTTLHAELLLAVK